MRLKDKVSIITGGAHGIGRGFAIRFADEGAKVVIADNSFEAANATAQSIRQRGGEALAIKTDVSVVEDTQEMVRKTIEGFGKVDILINSAAIFARVPIGQKPFYEMDLKEWDRTWEVNVKGVFLCCRAVFPHMKAQGRGKIINMSSGQYFRGGSPYAYWSHYVAQKGAIIGLTRALARELGVYLINVNCIAPGGTFTGGPEDTAELEVRKKPAERRAIKRVEVPEDVTGTAVFLASPDSDFITGQTIVVDGGDIML